ncbi:hypothetical protein BGZ92_000766 [Podila epicladia]|nr:hypothetical protein BGZ92_000766 [Podila epicladia]
MLKSFVLTSTSSSEQLELLRTNTGIVSLQWLNFKPDTVTVPLLNMLLPLAKTLKELTLWYHRDAQAHMPFSLLNMFTNLERLQIAPGSMMYSHEPSTPSFAAFQASAPAGSVQHMSLKQLTVMGARSTPFPFSLMTQIMSRSPNIKHLVISHINNCLMDGVHEQVIRLNAVYRAWIQSLISDAHLKALPADSAGSALESIPSDALQGLERLDILGMMSSYLRETWIRLQYERGCQDLVKISASVLSDGLNFLIPLLQQWKHMVQQVDIDCGAYITNRTAFSVFSQVLGSLTTLRRLRFVAEGGMTKQESFAIFRDKLGREDEDQGDGAGSETLVATIDDTSPAWVCQNLESLVIQGLWGTMSKDRPDKDQNALTLQAASDGHHWVAYGATKFGKQFRAIVSERIKTLPALRSLTLNRMAFDYFERGE